MPHHPPSRRLIVCADDLGIGPETSRGIIELARDNKITATVLLVNTPTAEDAVVQWKRANAVCDLGWHPCLTLDSPILPAAQVPSLVDGDGRFWGLGAFIKRWAFGKLRANEIAAEWRAQLRRFRDLVGADPVIVNAHQHVAVFRPAGQILMDLLATLPNRPYVRRVREAAGTLRRIPGARLKRVFLSTLANRNNRDLDRNGFPGNDVLAGIANHGDVHHPSFYTRWLERTRGRVIELMVHPGYRDETLLGRDCVPGDGGLERRDRELDLISQPIFADSVRRAGFRLTCPNELFGSGMREHADAA
ncbi:MAG: ChbG/HpnK family deacetylase [Planctomycetes bacterium]|nr:ChbG/HpnK family deacetylase [Planctomycetota bacterium]